MELQSDSSAENMEMHIIGPVRGGYDLLRVVFKKKVAAIVHGEVSGAWENFN